MYRNKAEHRADVLHIHIHIHTQASSKTHIFHVKRFIESKTNEEKFSLNHFEWNSIVNSLLFHYIQTPINVYNFRVYSWVNKWKFYEWNPTHHRLAENLTLRRMIGENTKKKTKFFLYILVIHTTNFQLVASWIR